MKFKQIITVISDASFREGAAGWAAWAKSDLGDVITRSGALTWVCENISEAETVSLVEGITAAVSMFDPPQGYQIVAQSDSCDALGVLFRVGKERMSQVRRAKVAEGCAGVTPRTGNMVQEAFAGQVIDLITSRGLCLHLKHVKGHSGKTDGRSRVNQWCDREAGKHQRSANPYQPKRLFPGAANG